MLRPRGQGQVIALYDSKLPRYALTPWMVAPSLPLSFLSSSPSRPQTLPSPRRQNTSTFLRVMKNRPSNIKRMSALRCDERQNGTKLIKEGSEVKASGPSNEVQLRKMKER